MNQLFSNTSIMAVHCEDLSSNLQQLCPQTKQKVNSRVKTPNDRPSYKQVINLQSRRTDATIPFKIPHLQNWRAPFIPDNSPTSQFQSWSKSKVPTFCHPLTGGK